MMHPKHRKNKGYVKELLKKKVDFLKVIADENRLKILSILGGGEKEVKKKRDVKNHLIIKQKKF